MALWPYVVHRGDFGKTLETKTTHSDVSYVCFASDAIFEADTTENETDILFVKTAMTRRAVSTSFHV